MHPPNASSQARNVRPRAYPIDILNWHEVVNDDLVSVPIVVVSRPGELHPRPLLERCVSLSTHTAPIKQTLPPCLVASAQTSAVAFLQFLARRDSPASCGL